MVSYRDIEAVWLFHYEEAIEEGKNELEACEIADDEVSEYLADECDYWTDTEYDA